MRRSTTRILIVLASTLGTLVLLAAGTFAVWSLRPNRAEVDRAVIGEDVTVVDDGAHASNTDFVRLFGRYWLAYVSSPYHFGTRASVLHLAQAESPRGPWNDVASFKAPDNDIRDPKLAVIGDRLFLYGLENRDFKAEPYRSIFTSSSDGVTWDAWRPVEGMDGWLFWRTLEIDGRAYATAYWAGHGKAALFTSTDGARWSSVSVVNEGARNDETEALLMPDGSLIATARLEYDESWAEGALGDFRGSTLIAVSRPPYETWEATAESRLTRLDGPALFVYRGRAFAIGRFQVERGWPFAMGTCLARKRTSLFEVRRDGLVRITDLPSSGDTSYGGVVVEGDQAWASYYTGPVDRDWPWILSMFRPTTVRMVRIDLGAMAAKASGIAVDQRLHVEPVRQGAPRADR